MDLEKKLSGLSEIGRKILQCLSIFWEPISANDIQKLLKVLDVRKAEGKVYPVQEVAQYRQSLLSKGLLVQLRENWGSGYQIADEHLREFLTREAKKEGWLDKVIVTIQTEFALKELTGWYWGREQKKFRILRDYRLAIYQKKIEAAQALFKQIVENNIVEQSQVIVNNIFSNPFQKDFLSEFDPRFQNVVLPGLIVEAHKTLEPTTDIWEFVRENNLQTYPIIKGIKAEEFVLRGEIAEAVKITDVPKNFGEILSTATTSFFAKDYEKSIKFFEEVIKMWKQIYGKKKGFPDEWQFFLYGLALYKTNEEKFHKFAEDYSTFCVKNYPENSLYRGLNAISYFLLFADARKRFFYAAFSNHYCFDYSFCQTTERCRNIFLKVQGFRLSLGGI
jgi:hypothetical protein